MTKVKLLFKLICPSYYFILLISVFVLKMKARKKLTKLINIWDRWNFKLSSESVINITVPLFLVTCLYSIIGSILYPAPDYN